MQTSADVDILYQTRSSTHHAKVLRAVRSLLCRTTCISSLVLATFILCLTQDFTYILNYHSFNTETWVDKGPSTFTTNNYDSGKVSSDIPLSHTGKHFSFNVSNLSFDIHSMSYNSSELSPITLYPYTPKMQTQHNSKIANTTDDWRRITKGVYAYSAYWDNRFGNKSIVKIIVGLVVPNLKLDMKCLLSNESSSEVYDEVLSTHDFLIEHHNKASRAAFIMCSTPKEVQPNFVALVPRMWNRTWTLDPLWINVHPLDNQDTKTNLVVCVRPMFNYTDTFRIVEFIAYYEALGADHFTFYNYDTLPEVSMVIRYLQDSNYSVDWLPWNLPTDIQDMWAMGQMANINDCIYRHMGTATYIAVVDLDEFITPRHVMTIQQLMSIHDVPWKNLGSFLIRSCVFCSEYQQDIVANSIPSFVTQTYIQRENKIWPYHHRSKYIVKPDLVVSAGIHFVREHVPSASVYLMKPTQVVVHHYRAKLCGDKGREIKKGNVDPMARKYLGHLLKSRAMKVWKEFTEKHEISNEYFILNNLN